MPPSAAPSSITSSPANIDTSLTRLDLSQLRFVSYAMNRFDDAQCTRVDTSSVVTESTAIRSDWFPVITKRVQSPLQTNSTLPYGKIEKVYSRAKLDDTEPSSSNNGFCFGLLDPVSNVIVNSVISPPSPHQAKGGGGGNHDGDDMIQRSLDGLVAFLTYLFPYLPTAEATAYIDAANADPLVAALLIIDRCGIRRFGFCSGSTTAAVEAALRCAAVASKHPDPQQLVTGWKLLSPHLKSLVSQLSQRSRSTTQPDAIVRHMLINAKLTSITEELLELEQSWELASSRCVSPKPEALPPFRGAMKRMLLSTIHGFYLQALARLPTAELNSRYHQSLLMGGYCYGPLDPVSNIIVNTLWYEEIFPTREQTSVTLHMMSTKLLARVVARSFYGLISFVCTRYPCLTPNQAMQRLLAAGADLSAADPNLCETRDASASKLTMSSWSCCLPIPCGRSGAREAAVLEGRTPSASVAEAYFAAATAAFHTHPLVQKEFLGSTDALPKLKLAAKAIQDGGRRLTPKYLQFISMLLCPQQQAPPPPLKLKRWLYPNAVQCVKDFWEHHDRVTEKVKAALDTYNKDTKQQFELHIICGVNERVGGRFLRWGLKTYHFNPMEPIIYHRSHVNFLAVPKGRPPSAAVLFFAQYNNYEMDGNSYDKDEYSSYCCVPMSLKDPGAEQIRCIYCEREVNRIVHPIRESFCGRDKEFEKVLLGEAPFSGSMKESYDNDMLIRDQHEVVDWVNDLKDDSIYTEFYVDEDDNYDLLVQALGIPKSANRTIPTS
ncbi:hypothetical protein PR202_ga18170 [Eleusine coracana subsp. coracana]|uniref:Uncharacterized protein n=1 Tax=Eleusine coracana subsp. coracana TaxID=191504 RepID=A0AAV5CR44_ELECO|nr:hypothetical protein PR202_ga18170 [Eleusine coracana subsp. coracana]